MTMHTTLKVTILLGAALAVAACNGPRRVRARPIVENGDRTESQDRIIARAAAEGNANTAKLTRARDSIYARAVSRCKGSICASIAKGEISLGMTQEQVMAATRTTPAAWTIREARDAAVMVPRYLGSSPRDATGEVVMVQFDDEALNAVSYRETQGIRVVSSPADTTTDGRAKAMADALIREGDQFNAAGDRARALDRYDRALALKADDMMLEYKIATMLDLQMRPVEAQIRYQQFLQSMELERIRARGEANAQLADAIARAQQRMIVLERQTSVPVPAPDVNPAPSPRPATDSTRARADSVKVPVDSTTVPVDALRSQAALLR
jgi:tetratricopeptide (TPR) repeat protein